MTQPTRIVDRVLSVDDRLDLLISQYRDHDQINGLLRGIYELADEKLLVPLRRLSLIHISEPTRPY